MADHLQRDRRKLVTRINRLIGQLQAVRAVLESDEGSERRCYEVMRQLASIKGALAGLTTSYLEGYARDHMQQAAEDGRLEEFAAEFLEVVRSFQR